MEFTFETQYGMEELRMLARVMRRTIRSRRSRRARAAGWCIAALGALLCGLELAWARTLETRTIVTLLVVLVLVAALLFEDRLNARLSRRQMLPGTQRMTAVFSAQGFETRTEAGQTQWSYARIVQVVETETYFALIFSANHAQLHDKRSLRGSTVDAFRELLEKATGMGIQKIA